MSSLPINLATDFFASLSGSPFGQFLPLVVAFALLGLSRLILAITDPNKYRTQSTTLPPGPPSHWIWGTTIPNNNQYNWRSFENWTKKYGEILTIYLGRKPLIIVGSYKAAMILMEKEFAGVTAGRPANIVPNWISGGNRILSMPYGDKWRRLRKALHQGLQPKMATSYEPIQLQGAVNFMLNLCSTPDAFQEHASVYAASVIMSITYGKTTPTKYTDPEIVSVTKCLARVGHASRPGSYFVESFPLLKYLPSFLYPTKKDAANWHKEESKLFLSAYKSSLGKSDCFASWLRENQKEYALSDLEASYLCGSMFGAGSDTTASALSIAIMAMTLYPKVTQKARAAIDQVVGRGRAPDFSDYEDLLYIQAFIKEVYRWRPVSSGGFVHATTSEIVYNNYIIPSGTSIVGNHWSISRDPEIFEEPEEFNPDRWLEKKGSKIELRTDIHHVGFGFGRRICSGKNVADRSLFINISLLLWSFTFSLKTDDDGNEIPIDNMGFTDAPNSHPLPYQVNIKARVGAKDILESMLSS